MPKYRNKPIVISAEIYSLGLEDGNICSYSGNSCEPGRANYCFHLECYDNQHLAKPYIDTLEGRHFITEGDYIITGVKGEKYPCKAEIFHMTYEEVTND